MMTNIIWVGSRQSDIKDSANFFKGSITLYGDNLSSNFSLCKINNRRISNNTACKLRDSFISSYIKKHVDDNQDTKFMFYDPLWAFEIEALKAYQNNFICLNDSSLLKTLENKISFKHMYAKYFHFVDSRIIDSASLSLELAEELFAKLGEPLIFQKEIANGGSGTFLMQKGNTKLISKLNALDTRFIVSKYIDNNIPINIHLVIYENEVLIFPASIQLIEYEDDCLLYKGGDYIAFNNLSRKSKSEFYECANRLGNLLRQNGFRGICGIDAIIDSSGQLFLMEVNPRFQGSSNILDRSLLDYGYDNLAKINYDAFIFKDSRQTNVNLNDLSVRYSCYSLINNNFGKKLWHSDIMSLIGCIDCEKDGLAENQHIGDNIYLCKLIFNKSIYQKQFYNF